MDLYNNYNKSNNLHLEHNNKELQKVLFISKYIYLLLVINQNLQMWN